jgi:hypothetical protein
LEYEAIDDSDEDFDDEDDEEDEDALDEEVGAIRRRRL